VLAALQHSTATTACALTHSWPFCGGVGKEGTAEKSAGISTSGLVINDKEWLQQPFAGDA
jgi:hypothetical protein